LIGGLVDVGDWAAVAEEKRKELCESPE